MERLVYRVRQWLSGDGYHGLYLLLTALVSGLYISYISLRTMPLSEGWYSIYARSINSGLVPYRDFELLFTPFYTYLIALFTRVFGYEVFALRVLGVLLFVTTGIVAFSIFRRLFKPLVSMVSAVVTVMFMQSEVVFIAYDYIRWFDLFVFIALLALLVAWTSLERDSLKQALIAAAVSGAFTSLAILTRQNSGLIYFAYSILAILFMLLFTGSRNRVLKVLLAFTVAVLAPITVQGVVLVATGSLAPYMSMTTTGAIAAKGGMRRILFAWIGRGIPVILANRWEILAVSLLLATGYLGMRDRAEMASKEGRVPRELVAGLMFSGAVVGGMYLLFSRIDIATWFSSQLSNPTAPYPLYFVVLLAFVVFVVLALKVRGQQSQERDWLVSLVLLLGAVLAVGYGAGTSGGLSQGETALAAGVLFALPLKWFEGRHRGVATVAILVAAALSVLTLTAVKNVTPYTWWGLAQEPIDQLDQTVDVPYMKHIRVSAHDKQMYEGLHEAIAESLESGDEMFVFPHMPIFYLTADRLPFTRSYVQWFDVVTPDTVTSDIELIEATRPKVIVFCEVPDNVIGEHEIAFNRSRRSSTRVMQDFLRSYTSISGYRPTAEYTALGDYRITVWVAE